MRAWATTSLFGIIVCASGAAACSSATDGSNGGSDANDAGDSITEHDAASAIDSSPSDDAVANEGSARDANAGDAKGDDGGARDGDIDGGAHADAHDADPGLGLDCSADGGDAASLAPNGAPILLGCTGLYSNWPSRTIAPGARAFDPGLHLWSDGADKSRWILLPPGTTIDTSNMDEWTFPVGTKIWKEFRLGGKRVETRYMWKRSSGDWLRTTYAWSQDQTTATQLTTGALNVFGTTYEIPTQAMCTTCHQGRVDGVLGFEAVSLASPAASGLTMSALVAEGKVTTPPSGSLAVPGTAQEKAALSFLHANCGTACHNRSPGSFAGSTGLWMRLDVARLASVSATDTYTTAVNQPSSFQPSPNAGLLRIKPGDSSKSAIPFRDGFRDDQGQDFQMPPIDTHVADTASVAIVKAWIDAMP